MEPTSSEEDMLASTRGQSQVQSVVIDHGAAEEQRDVVAALGSAPIGIPRPLPGRVIAQARPVHVREYPGIRVDRDFQVHSSDRRAGSRSPGVGGEKWMKQLGR